MLTEENRLKLDGIVKQMIENKEKDDDIQLVVNDFISKYNVKPQTTTPAPAFEGNKVLGALEKVGRVGGELMTKGTKASLGYAKDLITPTLKSVASVAYEPARAIQGAIPGGMTGKEEIKTPVGTLKPWSGMTGGEKTMEVIDVASLVPLGKLFAGGARVISKAGKGVLTGAGEILTGVEKGKLGQWFDLAKNEPEKLKAIKEYVSENPKEPYLGLAKKIANTLTGMKDTAQKAWKEAKSTFDTKFADTTFDISYKVGELNNTLNNFGLKLTQAKNKAGKLTENFLLGAKGKITGFTKNELAEINKVINVIKGAKNLGTDDLIVIRDVFNSAYDAIPFGVDNQPKKYHALIMSLKDASEEFIQEVLPKELKDANQLYRNYYDSFKLIGNRIMDKTGNIKTGAETFLGNITNLNKGAERKAIVEAGKKLGIDILDEAQNLNVAKELSELVPSSVKNRTMDVIRGIVGSNVFKAGAGAGVFVAPQAAIPAVIISILSSPKTYSGLIEIIAGANRGESVAEALAKLAPEEMIAIQQVIKGLIPRPEERNLEIKNYSGKERYLPQE